MREYRNLLKNDQRRTPIIPMIAVCLKDLFFIFNHAKTNDFEVFLNFLFDISIFKKTFIKILPNLEIG